MVKTIFTCGTYRGAGIYNHSAFLSLADGSKATVFSITGTPAVIGLAIAKAVLGLAPELEGKLTVDGVTTDVTVGQLIRPYLQYILTHYYNQYMQYR